MDAKTASDLGTVTAAATRLERVSVLTFNIWNTEHLAKREAALQRFFAIYDHDIICLQEVRPQTLQLLDKFLPSHARITEAQSAEKGWFCGA